MSNKLQLHWEKRATVRSRPRIIFNPEDTGYLFPLSHQPLSVHPEVVALGTEALDYLLTQSLFKYANDIAVIETKVVNKSVLDIITDELSIGFSDDFKMGAYGVLIDESYHAYVAFDAMKQIQNYTSIKPLPLPKTIEIEKASQLIKARLDAAYHNDFELITVCLAENTITKDIVNMTDKEETHPFFQRVIKDHLSDESRHSGYFFTVIEYLWANLEPERKRAIGGVLADFIELYLAAEVTIAYDKQILEQLGFSPEKVQQIVDDTHEGFPITRNHPMLKNIMAQLERAKVLDEYVLQGFREKDWIN